THDSRWANLGIKVAFGTIQVFKMLKHRRVALLRVTRPGFTKVSTRPRRRALGTSDLIDHVSRWGSNQPHRRELLGQHTIDFFVPALAITRPTQTRKYTIGYSKL